MHEITTLDVAAVLRPIWRTKPEVARKLYPAIRRVFEHARILLRDASREEEVPARRQLMEAWAQCCEPNAAGNVVGFGKGRLSSTSVRR